ncbi:MAG: hypothetical protein M1834_009226 [Cirrosporium novae-zelandiae]|nr:MAG: hypothetical protein M1834_009226 [Cirrosporium novae-zelandiae]
MTDLAGEILNHYNLTTPYPTEWPIEKDQSDESEEDVPSKPSSKRKSRYSALEQAGGGRRSIVPGTERTGDGRENLVQVDEPDPLGGSDTVVRALRTKGVPVEDNIRLRNRFLTSSTSFSPALFLSQVHSNDSTQVLLQGLDFLSRSIDQKSASLKILVESNFERFVRAKATIDNVYTEMRNRGSEVEAQVQAHSRHTSRNSMHFRSISGSAPIAKPPGPNTKKNALVKESEYGVQGIKAPLVEVSVKAEEIWGPALGGKEREKALNQILHSIETYRGIYEVGGTLSRCIKQKNYEQLVEEYARARKYADEARNIANKSVDNGVVLTDTQLHHIIVTGRMWLDVEKQVETLKQDVWRKLTGTPPSSQAGNTNQSEEYMELIGLLLELGVEENPITVWLLSRLDHLKTKINTTSERTRVEIEILRRHLANSEQPTPQEIAAHLRCCDQRGVPASNEAIDSQPVLEFWEHLHTLLSRLLSMRGGILGEVIEFWETAQAFIDGQKQKTLPTGIDGRSRKHHRLPSDGVRDLKNGILELVELLRENVFALFSEPPIEDISSLFSPLPPTTPNTPRSAALTPSDPRFKFDDLPPPSPRKGEAWEEFAFWPPNSNSVSGVRYLSKLLILLGTAAGELASLAPVLASASSFEKLKTLVSGARERCIRAVCVAWGRDAESCRFLEDWIRSNDNPDLTKMPLHFVAFESGLLAGMQKILYISEAVTKSGTENIIPAPQSKLLKLVQSQFVTSLYKALAGMVENAESNVGTAEDAWSIDFEAQESTEPTYADTLDISNRSVRMLLTLSNLKALRGDFVPQLITLFETDFSVRMSEESNTIRDALGQIDSRLFQMYTHPSIDRFSSIIKSGILADSFVPTTNRPAKVTPYVYQLLLHLVLIHTEVSTTAPSLTTEILSYLLEQVSSTLLDVFKQRPQYTLPALMQATLDVEFIAQTLTQYTTDKASECQSKIYLELDRRTTNDARARLQNQLPEMKATLKSLREKTRSEFACFKRPRSHRERSDA